MAVHPTMKKKENNFAEKRGFLYASLPLARSKENIEAGTLQILDRDRNSVYPGKRRELCEPWIETGTLYTLERDRNSVNTG